MHLELTNIMEGSTKKNEFKKKTDIVGQNFAGYLHANRQGHAFSIQQCEETGYESKEISQNRSNSNDKPNSFESNDIKANKIDNDNKNNNNKMSDADCGNVSNDNNDNENTRQDRTVTTPDSGQEGSDSKASCVDGCVKGFRPGASTEATVNAKLSQVRNLGMPESDNISDEDKRKILAKLNGDKRQDITSAKSNEFTQMIEQVINQVKENEGNEKQLVDIKLGAKVIDKATMPGQGVSHLSAQKVIFETGLAEHFVRALTDEFKKIASDAKTDDNVKLDNISHMTNNNSNMKGAGNSPVGKDALSSNLTSVINKNADVSEALNKALQIIKANVGLRHSRLTVHLNPPDLGKMRIDIKLVNNNLHLNIVTDTAGAKEILTNRADVLRMTLERQHINIMKFEVAARQQTGNTHQSFEQYHEQGQHAGNGGEFAGNQQFEDEKQNQQHEHLDKDDDIAIDTDELMNMVA